MSPLKGIGNRGDEENNQAIAYNTDQGNGLIHGSCGSFPDTMAGVLGNLKIVA
jgi:hypothetical protein